MSDKAAARRRHPRALRAKSLWLISGGNLVPRHSPFASIIERVTIHSITRRGKLSCALGLLLLAGCVARSDWNIRPEGRLSHAQIDESSGIVASRTFEDVFWTHNDDGLPEIFAVEEEGDLIRRYLVPEARNNDWEDIAIDDKRQLYVLDNTSRLNPERRSRIYVFNEPDPYRDREISGLRVIEVDYPDQGNDTEAMFVNEGVIYLVTKPWDGTFPRIYRLNSSERHVTAVFLGTVPVSAMITGADITPDGSRIALSSYRGVFVFEGGEDPGLRLQSAPRVCPLNAGQIEGIAWRDQDLILTNEQRAVFEISRDQWERDEAPFFRKAERKIPFVPVKPPVDIALRKWDSGYWLRMRAEGAELKIARVVWSPEGIHIGLDLPSGTRLSELTDAKTTGLAGWFHPGTLYILLNPSGDRPLSYGKDDRCIVIGRQANGRLVAEARSLRPATFIATTESEPSWVELEESNRLLLITLKSGHPGLGEIKSRKEIGFNLILIGEHGEVISWTPLTLRFSWDAPSYWGLLELGS